MTILEFPDAPWISERASISSVSASHGLEIAVASLVGRTVAGRGVQHSPDIRYVARYLVSAAERTDFSGARPDMGSDGAKNAVSTMTHLLNLSEPEVRLLVYLAFSRIGTMRAVTDADPWQKIDAAEIGPIGDTEDLAAVFEEVAFESTADFVARHFEVDAEFAASLTLRLLDRGLGYLSDKIESRALSALSYAHDSAERPEDGIHEVLARLSIQDRNGMNPPLFGMQRMRKLLVDEYALDPQESALFLRLLRPLLDRAFARCFTRFLEYRKDLPNIG